MPKAEPAPSGGGGSFLDDLTPLDEVDAFYKVGYFGQEGTGKTSSATFMANLPGDGVVIIVSVENGVKLGPLRDLGVDTSRIRLWPDPKNPIDVTYEELEKFYYKCANQLRTEPGSIKGMTWDTFSEASNFLLRGATEFQVEKSKNGRNPRDNARAIELQDYNTLFQDGRDLARKFFNLPCHHAVIFQEADGVPGEGEYKGFKQQAIELAGQKLRPVIYAAMDQVIRLRSETVVVGANEHEILVEADTAKSETLRVKDRFHTLPPTLPEPRFDRLVAYNSGKLVASDDDTFELYARTREAAEQYVIDKKAAARGRTKEK